MTQPILSSASNPFCAALPVPCAMASTAFLYPGSVCRRISVSLREPHARFLFQKPECVAGLDAGMLRVIAGENDAVAVSLRNVHQPPHVFARNQPGLIDPEHLPFRLLLHLLVLEEHFERFGVLESFLFEHAARGLG